jgi:hypothetical protein
MNKEIMAVHDRLLRAADRFRNARDAEGEKGALSAAKKVLKLKSLDAAKSLEDKTLGLNAK